MKRIFISLLLFSFLACADAHRAPELLLAKTYNNDINITDYWISEKLDGVRAYWDGQRLLSRQGNIIYAPTWFVADFPPNKLDGELWIARGTFEDTISTVKKHKPVDQEWQRVRYNVFELPEAAGTFTQRLEKLKALVAHSIYVQLIKQYRLTSLSALNKKLDETVAAGGEGLMLHHADALYSTGRSDVLLKLKKHSDAEAKVVAYVQGKGKHLGRLGALLLEMPDGKRFKLGGGFTDDQRDSPPPVGSWVTYKYYGLSQRGIPKFASFLRVRLGVD